MTKEELLGLKINELRLQLKEEGRSVAAGICQEAIDYIDNLTGATIMLSKPIKKKLGTMGIIETEVNKLTDKINDGELDYTSYRYEINKIFDKLGL